MLAPTSFGVATCAPVVSDPSLQWVAFHVAKQNPDLGDLLAEPREALDVEVKEWLDLTNNDHRALVAKEIIALANHGGGYLMIGFEELTDGSFKPRILARRTSMHGHRMPSNRSSPSMSIPPFSAELCTRPRPHQQIGIRSSLCRAVIVT